MKNHVYMWWDQEEENWLNLHFSDKPAEPKIIVVIVAIIIIILLGIEADYLVT